MTRCCTRSSSTWCRCDRASDLEAYVLRHRAPLPHLAGRRPRPLPQGFRPGAELARGGGAPGPRPRGHRPRLRVRSPGLVPGLLPAARSRSWPTVWSAPPEAGGVERPSRCRTVEEALAGPRRAAPGAALPLARGGLRARAPPGCGSCATWWRWRRGPTGTICGPSSGDRRGGGRRRAPGPRPRGGAGHRAGGGAFGRAAQGAGGRGVARGRDSRA